VRKERRERRVPGHQPGFGSASTPSVARHHDLWSSILPLLTVAPGRQPNFPMESRVTTSFLALDRLFVQLLSFPCALIRFLTCSTRVSRAPRAALSWHLHHYNPIVWRTA
jgi:hypothetical protein